MSRRFANFLHMNQVYVDTYDRLFWQGESVFKKLTTMAAILMICGNAFARANFQDPCLNGSAQCNPPQSQNQSAFSDANTQVIAQLDSALSKSSGDGNDMSLFNPLGPSINEDSKPKAVVDDLDDNIEK